MTAAILEIRDGAATGPLHTPVEKRQIGRNLWQRFKDVEPLEWPTVCGTKGYVYSRPGLIELGHTLECEDCKTGLVRKPRDVRGLPCVDCGTVRHRDARGTRCMACYRRGVARAKHGTRSRYVSGCGCELCLGAERDYQRQYKRDRRAGIRKADPWRKLRAAA